MGSCVHPLCKIEYACSFYNVFHTGNLLDKNVTFTFCIILIGPSCKLDMRDCSCLMDLILQVSWTLASLVKKNCLDGGSVTVIELE